MEDFSSRITRLSQELKALAVDLEWTAANESSAEQDRVMDRILRSGVGQDLKRAVELLNHFLWSYIDTAAAKPNEQVDYARQSSRLSQVTELLRLLHHSSCPLRDSLGSVEHAALAITRHLDPVPPREGRPLGRSA